MTAEGWRQAVLKAMQDPELMEVLIRVLMDQDTAKQRLRDLGYGVTGTPLLRMIDEVRERS